MLSIGAGMASQTSILRRSSRRLLERDHSCRRRRDRLPPAFRRSFIIIMMLGLISERFVAEKPERLSSHSTFACALLTCVLRSTLVGARKPSGRCTARVGGADPVWE